MNMDKPLSQDMIDTARKMWIARKDTHEIARVLGVPESQVWNERFYVARLRQSEAA